MSLGARQHDCGCPLEAAWQQRDLVEVLQEEHVEHLRRSQGTRQPMTVPARTPPKPANHRQHEDEAAEAVEWSRRLAVGCAKSIPMDPDLDAEQLATFRNPEIEIK